MHHGHQENRIFGLLTMCGKGSNPSENFISFLKPFIPALREFKEMNLDRELFLVIVKITVDHNSRVPFTLDISNHNSILTYESKASKIVPILISVRLFTGF